MRRDTTPTLDPVAPDGPEADGETWMVFFVRDRVEGIVCAASAPSRWLHQGFLFEEVRAKEGDPFFYYQYWMRSPAEGVVGVAAVTHALSVDPSELPNGPECQLEDRFFTLDLVGGAIGPVDSARTVVGRSRAFRAVQDGRWAFAFEASALSAEERRQLVALRAR